MKFTFTSMTMPCAIGLVVALLPDNSAFLKTAMSDTVTPVVQVLPSQTMYPNETLGSKSPGCCCNPCDACDGPNNGACGTYCPGCCYKYCCC